MGGGWLAGGALRLCSASLASSPSVPDRLAPGCGGGTLSSAERERKVVEIHVRTQSVFSSSGHVCTCMFMP